MSLRKGDIFIAGAGKDGKDGANGIDGFSPTVSLTKEDNKTILSITDKNGTKTTEILDGSGAEEVEAKIGNLEELTTEDKTNIVNAINEVANNSSGGNENTGEIIGNLEDLATTDKSNLVSAINEVNTNATTAKSNASTAISRIGTLSSLNTSTKTNLVNAINEVKNSVTSTTTTLSSGLKVVEERTTLFSGSSTLIGNYNYFTLNITDKSELQEYDYLEVFVEGVVHLIRGSDDKNSSSTFFNLFIVNKSAIDSFLKNSITSIGTYNYLTSTSSSTGGTSNEFKIKAYDSTCKNIEIYSQMGGSSTNRWDLPKAKIVGVKVRAVNL